MSIVVNDLRLDAFQLAISLHHLRLSFVGQRHRVDGQTVEYGVLMLGDQEHDFSSEVVGSIVTGLGRNLHDSLTKTLGLVFLNLYGQSVACQTSRTPLYHATVHRQHLCLYITQRAWQLNDGVMALVGEQQL